MLSLNFIILSFIMTQWTLKQPADQLSATARLGRETLWLAVGLLNYGITVSNGMISFLAYGFGGQGRRGWARAIAYGAVVLILGILLTFLTGSLLNIVAEKQWLVNDTLRGGTPPFMTMITIVTPTLWSFIVPWPTLHGTMENGHLIQMGGILHWNFTPGDWLLAGILCVFLVLAIRAAVLDRDPIGRRLSMALAAAMGFHMIMHRFYYQAYEGVFFFTPHSLFLLIGLCVPLALSQQTSRHRWPARTGLLVLALVLALRNYHYILMYKHIVPLP